jgi:hypothetical protein
MQIKKYYAGILNTHLTSTVCQFDLFLIADYMGEQFPMYYHYTIPRQEWEKNWILARVLVEVDEWGQWVSVLRNPIISFEFVK